MTDLTERRAHQYEKLVSLLGESRTALEALNEIDQIGIEETSRADVVDALISSIEKGQEWATGASSIQIRTCAVCEGAKSSRSGRGRCRACKGTGRTQVKCRACVGVSGKDTSCIECRGSRELDPVDERETILRQHREWWEKVTTMKSEKRSADWSIQQLIEGCVPAATRDHEVLVAQRGRDAAWHIPGRGVVRGKIADINYIDTLDDWRVVLELREAPFGSDPRRSVDPREVFVGAGCDVHPGPPERPTAKRGVVEREGGVRLYWDHERGNDMTGIGIGTLEKPFATYQQAEVIAEEMEGARAKQHVAALSTGLVAALLRDGEETLPPASPMPRVIAIALLRAQTKIKRVAKESRNEGDDYSYTNAETIIDEARGALLENGLCVTLFRWKRTAPNELEVTFMWIHESGEQHVCEPVPMPIVEDGGRDKRAPDKALATALTYTESQWLRIALQIPRIGKAEDADARADSGAGRSRSRQNREDSTPLSTELNDTVLALHEGIENAKSLRSLNGVKQRLEQVKERLPANVVARVTEKIVAKEVEIAPPAPAEGSST